MTTKYRIVEQVAKAHRPDWPWRFQVEECWPERRARFLWWSWTVPETWVSATAMMKLDQCRMWIGAAERGELTRVVER